ncbi:MAG: inorganic pyrophosphatase [Pyrinomonadaceae bacterium]|nr:inorganic pyrophosphatase [Pyrinomonadaceae bacterium]
MSTTDAELQELLGTLFQAHPWHGVSAAWHERGALNAYIEIVPTDAVKYELDKRSGHLKVDRPQRFSSMCPTLYGFIPQTYCGTRVGQLCSERTGTEGIKGDGDPMDICVLSEKAFTHGNFFVRAKPIGGLRMIDAVEADDKIISVLESDVAYGHINELSECPQGLVDRIKHYFLSYKQLPEEAPRRVEITDVYGRDEAAEVIKRSFADYRERFGAPEDRVSELRRLLGK